MLKEITIGQYIPGDSFVHRLDPRTKILSSILFIVALFLINKYVGYIAVFAYLGVAIISSKVKFKMLYNGLKPVFILILFTAALNVFMTTGTEATLLFQKGFIKIYKEGINTAVFMGLRLVLLILGTSLLTLTTSPIELTDGIESLLKPLKKIGVPAHELAMMMTIALRFIPTLMDETDKIMKAQQARGADFESGNIIQKAKNLIPLLVPLFISSFRRADELAMAMEARCYRGGKGRTRMKQLAYTAIDYVAFLLILALIAVGFYIRFALK